MDEAQGPASDGSQSDVWSAISAFEQILEAMPEDRASLEALVEAYIQIGDHAQAKEHLLRLAELVVAEQDRQAVGQLLPRLESYAEDEAVQAMLARLGPLAPDTEAAVPEEPAEGPQPEERRPTGFRVAEELSLAWSLLEADQLTQEDYSAVVQDLTELSSSDSAVTVSVLHVVEARAAKDLDRIVSFIAAKYGTPAISPSSFALRPDAVGLLPMDFMVRRGVLIFSLIGRDALAVVMNPADSGLREEAQTLAGRRCHFFVCVPSEFDRALDRVSDILAERSGAEEAE